MCDYITVPLDTDVSGISLLFQTSFSSEKVDLKKACKQNRPNAAFSNEVDNILLALACTGKLKLKTFCLA